MPGLGDDTLVLSALDVIQGAEEVTLRILNVGRIALLAGGQVGVNELNESIEIFGRYLLKSDMKAS